MLVLLFGAWAWVAIVLKFWFHHDWSKKLQRDVGPKRDLKLRVSVTVCVCVLVCVCLCVFVRVL